MNVGKANISSKTQIQSDTLKQTTVPNADQFTGQLAAAQIDLGVVKTTGGKTAALEASKELFEDKKSKHQIEEEKIAEDMVATYVIDHQVKQAKSQEQWSNVHAQDQMQGRKMTNQSAQFRFNKGIDELQGRVADKITEQKVMEKRGRLFNPALIDAATGSASAAKFTEGQTIGDHKPGGDSNQSSSTTYTQQIIEPNTASQKRESQQAYVAMKNAESQTMTRLQTGAAAKTDSVQALSQGNSAQVQGAATRSMLGQKMKFEMPAMNFTNTGTSQDVSEAKRLEPKVPVASPKYTSQVEVKDLGQNIKMMLNAKKTELTMKLKPEHLGKVEIKLSKDGELLKGKMKVDSVEAKEAMERALPELRDNLLSQGFKVDEFTIDLRDQPASSFAQTGDGSQQQASQQGAQNASPKVRNSGFEPSMASPLPEALRQSTAANDNLSIYA